MFFTLCYKYVKQKLYNMKEKIENRLKELYDEYNHVKNRNWIKETNGLTQRQRIENCEILIKELETLLNS